MNKLISMGQKAKESSYELGVASINVKNDALFFMAEELVNAKDEIIEANKIDLINSEEKGTPKPMLDRLALDEKRINEMAEGLREVASLQDPVGEVVSMCQRPNVFQLTVSFLG